MSEHLGHGYRTFQFGIGMLPCANGQTHEFFLTLPNERGVHKRAFNGVGVFRDVATGDHLPTHAWQALKELLAK